MSHKEFQQIARDEMLFRNPNVRSEVIDSPGTGFNSETHVVATAAAEMEARSISRHAARYIDTSNAGELVAYGQDTFRESPLPAAAALVVLTFARTGGGVALTLNVGDTFESTEGPRFSLVEAVSFNAGDNGPRIGFARSSVAGADQSVPAGTVTSFSFTSPDPLLTVTNEQAAAGGSDGEQAWHYRERLRTSIQDRRGSTEGAIEALALSVPQVNSADAWTPVGGEADRPFGIVYLAIADENGRSNAAMESEVAALMPQVVAAGALVQIIGGVTPVYPPIQIRVSFLPDFATADNLLAVRQNISEHNNRLKANAAPSAAESDETSWLTPGYIQHAARMIRGVVDVEVIQPAATVKPNQGEIIKTRLSDIST